MLNHFSGYLCDPKELPGLAHFCEHMLFLGTKKYPNENDYVKFLSEHGGSSNAATYPDHTLYYFDVIPEQLKSSLDRYVKKVIREYKHHDFFNKIFLI